MVALRLNHINKRLCIVGMAVCIDISLTCTWTPSSAGYNLELYVPHYFSSFQEHCLVTLVIWEFFGAIFDLFWCGKKLVDNWLYKK